MDVSDQTVEPGGTNLAIFEAASAMRMRAVRACWVLGACSGMVPYLLTKSQVTQVVTSRHRSHPTPV